LIVCPGKKKAYALSDKGKSLKRNGVRRSTKIERKMDTGGVGGRKSNGRGLGRGRKNRNFAVFISRTKKFGGFLDPGGYLLYNEKW